MENYTDLSVNKELEQMRKQLEILNSKLDNEMNLHLHQVHKYMDKVDGELWRQLRLPLLIIPLLIFNMVNFHISWWVYLVLALFASAAIYQDLHVRRTLRAEEWYLHKDLVATRLHVLQAQRLHQRSYYITLPLGCLFLFFFCYDLLLHEDPDRMRYIMWGIAVGLAIGIPLGLYRYHKVQSNWRSLVRHIQELKAEE